jgi:tRNA (mo5U34)-methyltransferase
MTDGTDLTREQIEERVRALGDWFHNIDLRGVRTAPHHFLGDYPRAQWMRLERVLPRDLTGKSVLDVGCNAGFYAIEMKRRGAARVVGIDTDEGYLEQARFAAGVCGADIELYRMSVYDVARRRDRFDLVIAVGDLQQLRHPLLALELLATRVVRDTLVLQSVLRGVPTEEAGDAWWIPNRACVEETLANAGFDVRCDGEAQVYVCTRKKGDASG